MPPGIQVPPPEDIKIDKPSSGLSLIPVVGSYFNFQYNMQEGNYGWATFYATLMVSDFTLARTVVTGIGKGCWKVGSHTWSATRSWFGRSRALVPNTPVHHAFIKQSNQWFPEWFKNQPWNLVAIENMTIRGTEYSSQTVHLAIHGTSKQLSLYWYEKLVLGIPGWSQQATLNFSLRSVTLFEKDCQCTLEHPNQTVIKESESLFIIPE
jgi:hypothetical protein